MSTAHVFYQQPPLADVRRTVDILHGAGLRCIPLYREDNPKAPSIYAKNWADPNQFFGTEKWLGRERIGLACGLQPNGYHLAVADLDAHPERGADAQQEHDRILAEVPELFNAFRAVSTGGSGRYIAALVPFPVARSNIYNPQGVHIGEMLGSGSQVVYPERQRVLHGDVRHIIRLDAETAQRFLAAVGYNPDAKKNNTKVAVGAVAGQQPAAEATTGNWLTRPGDDYNQRGADDMLRRICARGVRITGTKADGTVMLARPGKDGRVVSATFNSPHCLGRLYIFSGSDFCGLPNNQGLSPFNVYLSLEHSGNGREAAYALHQLGYGIARPRTSRKHRATGNPRGSTSRAMVSHEDYLSYVGEIADASGRSVLSQDALAEHFGVVRRTIQRVEAELVQAGKIVRHRPMIGKPSTLEMVAAPCDTLATKVTGSNSLSTPTVTFSKQVSHENAPAPRPERPSISLDDALYAVLNTIRDDGARATAGRVVNVLASYFPDSMAWWPEEAIEARRVVVARRLAFEVEVQQLQTMTNKDFQKKLRWAERVLPQGENTPGYWKAMKLWQHLQAEEERRAEINARLSPQKARQRKQQELYQQRIDAAQRSLNL